MEVLVEKHIRLVRAGDTVRCDDGLDRTVCVNHLKRDPFMGITLWGDCYASGTKLVKTIEYHLDPTPNTNGNS